jgi:hypothetical protein
MKSLQGIFKRKLSWIKIPSRLKFCFEHLRLYGILDVLLNLNITIIKHSQMTWNLKQRPNMWIEED